MDCIECKDDTNWIKCCTKMEAERISHDGRHDDLKEDMKSFDLSQLAKTVDSFETTKGIKLTRHLADTALHGK